MTETYQYGSLREKIAAERKEREERYAQFQEVYDEANRAGFAAAEAITPRAMFVTQEARGEEPRKMWHEPEGVCGFAWIRIRPATCSFARWLVKNNHARKAYKGGVDIWISAHGQSMQRKEAHARKMAEVLKEKLQLKSCYADSRLD